jgi:hypothetical protein
MRVLAFLEVPSSLFRFSILSRLLRLRLVSVGAFAIAFVSPLMLLMVRSLGP